VYLAFDFTVAEAKFEGLPPQPPFHIYILVPSGKHNHPEEWRKVMTAQVPNPKQIPLLKNDTKSEPCIKCFGKIIFLVPFFRLIFINIYLTACKQNP